MRFAITQLLGIIAWIIDIYSYWFNCKKKILFVQIIADILYVLHYYMLNAWVGAITCIISLIREFCFYFSNTDEQENMVCMLFISVYVIIGIIAVNSVIDLLPILAEIVYCYTLTKSTDWIVFGGIVDAVYWLAYGIVSKSYSGVMTDSIVIISNYMSLRNKKENNCFRKNKKIINLN